MNSRMVVEKTLNFDSPSRIPRHIWLLPWAEENHPDIVKKIALQFPDDVVHAPVIFRKSLNTKGGKYTLGEYIDEWGCKFINNQSGVIGIVEEALVASWEDVANLTTPEAALSVDREAVNSFCSSTEKFVLAGMWQRPFERFQFLRTTEQALMDFAFQPPELFDLLDKIHQHYCKEIEVWARTDVDAITLMDDWGMQQGLLMSPAIFREIFKPMYQEYVSIAKSYNKYVFMHSDGNIFEIIEDLIDVGIDALNSQVFCMDMNALRDRYRGRITFWGEIDRQNILAYGSAEDVVKAVHTVYENLYQEGGLIAECEFGPGAKPENIITVQQTLDSINRKLLNDADITLTENE